MSPHQLGQLNHLSLLTLAIAALPRRAKGDTAALRLARMSRDQLIAHLLRKGVPDA